jgi:uracil-DNA glycosylase
MTSEAPVTESPGQTAAPLVPDRPTLDSLRVAAAGCRACRLWRTGTQTVFGDGAAKRRLMFIGEIPGDEEDRAGRLLARILDETGLGRDEVYLTNVVKHFKWIPQGNRRMHQKPTAREIHACFPWLEAEIDVVKPRVIDCLGATAAQALLGRDFRVTRQQGQPTPSPYAELVLATIHPASVLRNPDPDARRSARAALKADLAKAARLAKERDPKGG